jgi:hypothetical protein
MVHHRNPGTTRSLLHYTRSCATLVTMTSKQKRIVISLAIVNGVFIAIIAAVLLRGPDWLTTEMPTPVPRLNLSIPSTTTPPDTGDTHITQSPATLLDGSVYVTRPARSAHEQCLWEATQHLAAAGLSATVNTRPDDTLWFQITFPLTNSQPYTDAAQAAWTAFDIALALHENDNCPSFDQISVNINAEALSEETSISVEVETANLLALSNSALEEEEFIGLVRYATHTAAIQTPATSQQDQ